jgi:hypothetical protein
MRAQMFSARRRAMRIAAKATLGAFLCLALAASAAEAPQDAPPKDVTPAAAEPAAAPRQTPATPPAGLESGVFRPDAPKVMIERGPCPGEDCVRHCTNCHHGRPPALPFPRDRI